MFKSVEGFVQVLGEDPRLKSIMGVVALLHSFLEITAKVIQKAKIVRFVTIVAPPANP